MKTYIGILTLWLLTQTVVSQVNFEWSRSYNGPADSADVFGAMVLDQNSNVYVAGSSIGTGTGLDFLTIKYSTAGVEQWTARYNSVHSKNDNALAIDVDNSGNTYITGNCNIDTNSNILTVKFNSGGVLQWAAEHSGSSSMSYGTSIVTDGSGNSYVTGTYNGDIMTIKYNSNGVQQWAKNFNGPANGFDAGKKILLYQNNIYVLGYVTSAANGTDFIVLKYDLNGNPGWSSSFNNPEYNKNDDPSNFRIDNQGNIYIAGNSANPAMSLQYQLLLVKMNSSGTVQWYRLITSSVSFCLGYDLVLDSYGNVYVAGQTTLASQNSPQIIAKYNSQGVQQWLQTYSSSPGSSFDDVGYSIAVDGNNYIFVLDLAFGSTQPYNYRKLLKYNTNGDIVEVRSFQCALHPNQLLELGGIQIDGSGSIFTSGGTLSLPFEEDYLTLKYSQSEYSVSGHVTYVDNNLPVNLGYVKALYYDKTTATIVTVDSTVIQSGGYYVLPHCWKDSLFIMVYQNDENLDFVPTYYISTTDWQQATKVYPYQNLANIDVHVHRIMSSNGAFAISGYTMQQQNPVKDAIVYIQSGGFFRNCGISNSSGYYTAGSLSPGSYTVTACRIGYSPVTQNIQISSGNLTDVNFNFADPIGIKGVLADIPNYFKLYDNYPNPFNPASNIKFDLPHSSYVKLAIYDMLGREIEVLVSENLTAGTHSYRWDAKYYPSGAYFYRLSAGNFYDTKKMVLIK